MSEKRTSMIWLMIVLVLLLGIVSMSMWGPWGGYMPGMMGMMGYGWGSLFLIPLAFLILIGVGAYYLIAEFSRKSKPSSRGDETALDILRERYAKGEIARQEYMKMKKDLES